jgi:hypothetical protein
MNFFVSYNRADQDWAEWIAWHLEEAGYTTLIQAWDFGPGANFVLEMDRATTEAERTIAILSPAYLGALYTKPEWAEAFRRDPTGEQRLLVPIRVAKCEIDGLLGPLVYIDLVDVDVESAKDKLLAGVRRERAKPSHPPGFPGGGQQAGISPKPRFPGTLPAIWNMPFRSKPTFTGREELFTSIRAALTVARPGVLPQVLYGLGGIGKTQLAVEYCYRYINDYAAVWWVRAGESKTLAGDYAGLAVVLRKSEPAVLDQRAAVSWVRQRLPHERDWLLIFDEASGPEALSEYLPIGGTGHILITSRNPNWGEVGQARQVRPLPQAEASTFLRTRAPQSGEGTEELAVELGELPLALEQAAAYLVQTGRTAADYLEMFRQSRGELLARPLPPGGVAREPVATTWKLAIDQVQAASPAAADLLNLCAFLAPDDIFRELLRCSSTHLPSSLIPLAAARMGWDDAVLRLRRYSLVEAAGDELSVHRLVQSVVRDRLAEQTRASWAITGLRVVQAAFPDEPGGDVMAWPYCARLVPHAMAVIEHVRAGGDEEVAEELLRRVEGYLRGRAQLAEAEARVTALDRIKEDRHTEADLEVLRRAYLAGRVTIVPEQRSVAIGGSAEGAVILTDDGSQVVIQQRRSDVLRTLRSAQATLDPREQNNRRQMLRRVRRTWIDGFLENSLQGAALQVLGLDERPEAVLDRREVVVQQPNRPAQILPRDTSIGQVFDDLDRQLLILGEPGAGKTTTLLELTRNLLDRADHDADSPIPVVFPLATWASKRLPLPEWLVDELSQRYDVPRRIGQAWVTNDLLLPLLDGLDEVAAEHRGACVEAINAYQERRGTVTRGIVVTSRIADYDLLTARVRLRGAVLLRPLGAEQIETYLTSAGEQLAGVRAALRADATLRELATSPLFLSEMTLAYRGAAAEALPTSGPIDERRTQVFAVYVQQMFKRRGFDSRYSREQTLHWLGWLARELTSQNQTVFYVERLQPEWLPTVAMRRCYAVIDRFASGLVVGLIYGIFSALISGLLRLPYGAVDMLFDFLVGALLAALFGEATLRLSGRKHDRWQIARRAASGALLIGLSTGFVAWLHGGLGVGLISGFEYGLIGALAGALAGGPSLAPRRIIVVESVRWSGSAALSSASVGLLYGLVGGLVGAIFFALSRDAHWFILTLEVTPGIPPGTLWVAAHAGGLAIGILGGLAGWLLFGLVGGLSGRQVEATLIPNQGIRRSARTAILAGLCGWLGVGLLFGLIAAMLYGLIGAQLFALTAGLQIGLVNGLLGGLVIGLAFGGYACHSHGVLRFLLWRLGVLPLCTISFLNYATERVLLRRVGGGYIFLHPLLQEYFAKLEAEENSSGLVRVQPRYVQK